MIFENEKTLSHDSFERELYELYLFEDYEKAESSLSYFVRAAFSILDPGKRLLLNWHIEYICEHLEAVNKGQIKKLIINQPPRSLKSIISTICFPAWTWIKNPEKRFMFASYSAALSLKHSVDRRQLITSPWYQRAWHNRFSFAHDQNEKSQFMNSARGHMIATSVGGTSTGAGADCLVVDDPLNPVQAASDTERVAANTWFDTTFSTRLNDKKTGSIIIIMQRLHDKDLTGHLLSKKDSAQPWTHLCIPSEAPIKTTVVFPISKKEITREEGDILHPEREGLAELEQAKINLGPQYAGQYLQSPTPAGGGFFKRSWWKRYIELPYQKIETVQFWDCAQKPGITNDYSVCETWVHCDAGFYLIDVFREKLTFPELCQAAKDLYFSNNPDAVVIEDKSHGTALIQELQNDTTIPVIAWPAEDSKIVRASRAQPTAAAGNCYLPESRSWVEMFISELEKFPNAEHDDQVDCFSMMVEYFKNARAIEPRIRRL